MYIVIFDVHVYVKVIVDCSVRVLVYVKIYVYDYVLVYVKTYKYLLLRAHLNLYSYDVDLYEYLLLCISRFVRVLECEDTCKFTYVFFKCIRECINIRRLLIDHISMYLYM